MPNLRSTEREPMRRKRALRARGALGATEAGALRRHAEAVRTSWRQSSQKALPRWRG